MPLIGNTANQDQMTTNQSAERDAINVRGRGSSLTITDGGAVARALDSADRAFGASADATLATLTAADTMSRVNAGLAGDLFGESLGFVGEVFDRYAGDVGRFADKASATDAERLQTIIKWGLIALAVLAALYFLRSK